MIGPRLAPDPITISVHARAGRTAYPFRGCGTYATVSLAAPSSRERSAGLAARKPREREVARAQGYLPPQQFLALFQFVAERAYEKGSLADYLKAQT